MKVVNEKNAHLYLTLDEMDILSQASLLLYRLAQEMERGQEVEYSDKICTAQNVIDNLLDHAEEENFAMEIASILEGAILLSEREDKNASHDLY